MAQTYAQFKAYVTKYLWRDNDTDLANSLDVLIQQADDELDKITRDWQRRQKIATIAPTSQDFDLTTNVADFQSIKSLTNNASNRFHAATKALQQTTIQHIYQLRAHGSDVFLPYYSIDRNDGSLFARFVAPFSVTDPGDLIMQYVIAVPDYSSDDASWMEDEYLNLYLYTVLKHCALFLREDDRVTIYAGLHTEALQKADEDDKHNLQFGGSPLRMRPHRAIP